MSSLDKTIDDSIANDLASISYPNLQAANYRAGQIITDSANALAQATGITMRQALAVMCAQTDSVYWTHAQQSKI